MSAPETGGGRWAALSEAKRALLSKRLRDAASGTAAAIPRQARRLGEHSASYAQQRLWFIDQLAGGSAGYGIPCTLHLIGELDHAALELAFERLLHRHDALRTTFVNHRAADADTGADGELVQEVAPPSPWSLPIADLRSLDERTRAERLHGLREESSRAPWDLRGGPLLRASLVLTGERESYLLVAVHHIVSDGWSVALMVRELGASYAAIRSGQTGASPDLPLQYADYARWQAQQLSGARLAKLTDYWRSQLADAPSLLTLAAARPRPPVQSAAGACVSQMLDAELTLRLRNCARAHDATLFTVLLAGYAALLARYGAQADLVIGTPVANRPRPELEGLIGLFVNTVPLRLQIPPATTFAELLARVQDTALGAFAHQDLPFEKLVESVRPERSLQHHPIFQTLFVLQNTPPAALQLENLELRELPTPTETAKLDLSVSIEETAAELEVTLEYSTDLFDAATATQLLAHYRTLLVGLATEPGQLVAGAPLLSAVERTALLDGARAAPDATPSLLCAHQLFEAQAARKPDAVALIAGTELVRYGDLNERANQLARALRDLGVGPDVPVAVATERSPDMVLAILAIWKAGGAYVPVDPTYPAARIEAMLDVAAPSIVLTQRALLERFARPGLQVLTLDALPAQIAANDRHDLVSIGTPAHLSHVIFTSGSTGTPKGVAIEHHSTVARLQWARARYSDAELAGVLAATSLSFDLSVFELWAPLSWGGTAILARNALEYPTLPARERVRLINTVPSALAEIVRVSDLDGVLVANVAGEALPRGLVDALYAKRTVQRVFNLYGPSEDTTYSTEELVPASETARPTIGRPLPGTAVHLLDTQLEPVPTGVIGEIYIGGVGLARGYLNRPDLTRERFVPDPFASEPHARLYRTGDLGRRLPDGRIDYLGRSDHQTKLRGFRIELGDIEACLRRHPAVREAVVVARVRPDDLASGQLVAYVSAQEQRSPDEAELRAHTAAALPSYMVPSTIVILERLPLSPNGKIDRARLPEPPAIAARGARAVIAPRTAVEFVLASIFARLLGVPEHELSVDDDFFALGGHSLKLLGLAAEVEARLGRTLPLARIFQAPTVEGLTALLQREEDGPLQTAPLLPLLAGNDAEPPLYLVHPASGNALVYRELAAALRERGAGPVFGLHAPTLEGEGPDIASIEELAALYVEAITRARPHGPYLLGGWSLGGVVAYEMARQLAESGRPATLLVLLDTWAPVPAHAALYGDCSETELLVDLARDHDVALSAAELAGLEREAQLRLLLERARAAHVIPPGLGLRDIERLVSTYRSLLALVRGYVPRPYAGPVGLIRAEQTLRDAPEGAADLGWGPLCATPLRVLESPGTHQTLVFGANAAALATELRRLAEPPRDL